MIDSAMVEAFWFIASVILTSMIIISITIAFGLIGYLIYICINSKKEKQKA